MQPFYLPWVGFFDLIAKADYFVFLDNVKIEKSSWQTRNQILINNQPSFITVSIKGSRNQLISEVVINDEIKWREKHIATIANVYKKHPFGKWVLDLVVPVIEDTSICLLSDLNIELIKIICRNLDIKSKFYMSSQISTSGTKSRRLIEICNHFQSTNYYSPKGSKKYIDDENHFTKSKINVFYQNIILKKYNQFKSNNFVSNLSIIDLMANLGPDETTNYINNLKT
mgnify:CR=1 FL=1